MLTILFMFGILFSQSNGDKSTNNMESSIYEMVYQSCLDRTGYLPLDNNSFFRVVDVSEMARVHLPCSFCGESNEQSPWYWKWRPRISNTSDEQEVQLGLAVELESNRVFMFPNHTLVLQNVTVNDSGIYFCRSLMEEDSKEFQFSVDIVLSEVPVVEENKVSWGDYQYRHIGPTNKEIYSSNDSVVRTLLEKVHVKVHSEWDPWLSCDGCLGIRKRYAKCRLYLSLAFPLTDSEDRLDRTQLYLYHSEHPSCHSIQLSMEVPQISSFVKEVPNFLRTQACHDSCPTNNIKSKQAKYRSDVHLQVGSSMSFICPGADLKDKVLWKRNGINIKPIKSLAKKGQNKMSLLRNPFKRRIKKGNVFVDRFSVLQMCEVTDDDTAVYNCYVNSKLVKTFNITVVIGEHTEKQRYYQYLLLSTYTSITSAIIVFLGIAWAFYNRDEFPTVEEIEAAQRNRNAIRDGLRPVSPAIGDLDGPENRRGSILHKRRFSLIGERTNKYEHHEIMKDSITFKERFQKKRQSKTENYKPSEKLPLI